MTEPTEIQVRVSPDGEFVAQRFPLDFNGHGHWIQTYLVNGDLRILVLGDDAVADWRRLVTE